MSDFNPSPIELTSIISRIIDGRERISSVLHSYRLPLDPSFSSTTIPLDKIDTIIPLQTSLKPEKNTMQSSITFEKLPVETNVKKSILFEKNELELKKEVETGEKNEEEPVLNLQHLAILKPALLEALANQEKLFRSRLQVVLLGLFVGKIGFDRECGSYIRSSCVCSYKSCDEAVADETRTKTY